MAQNSRWQEQEKRYGQVVAKAWEDEGFKQRLLADPQAVLQEQGIAVPAGLTVRVVENTADTLHLVLPPKPATGELSDEQLDQVAGGFMMCASFFSCGCTTSGDDDLIDVFGPDPG